VRVGVVCVVRGWVCVGGCACGVCVCVCVCVVCCVLCRACVRVCLFVSVSADASIVLVCAEHRPLQRRRVVLLLALQTRSPKAVASSQERPQKAEKKWAGTNYKKIYIWKEQREVDGQRTQSGVLTNHVNVHLRL
jgi:hypothetical protein